MATEEQISTFFRTAEQLQSVGQSLMESWENKSSLRALQRNLHSADETIVDMECRVKALEQDPEPDPRVFMILGHVRMLVHFLKNTLMEIRAYIGSLAVSTKPAAYLN